MKAAKKILLHSLGCELSQTYLRHPFKKSVAGIAVTTNKN
jgi:hypothetical protein